MKLNLEMNVQSCMLDINWPGFNKYTITQDV